MDLSKTQIDTLLGLVASAQDDALDCDGCFNNVAEFADTKLAGRPLREALEEVQIHLDSCPCCEDEYNALLEGLNGLE